MIEVFVYGTLHPGKINYPICASGVVAARSAIADGRLYALPFGYPAMTPGTDPVQGAVLSFVDAEILATLDEFERHDPATFRQYAPELAIEQHQYDRQKIKTYDTAHRFLGNAWSYVMTIEQVHRLRGVLIPDGRWQSRLSESLFRE